jgi:starvation-inducible DNA-binding protein
VNAYLYGQLVDLDDLSVRAEHAFADTAGLFGSLHLEAGEMIEAYWRWSDALKHRLAAIGTWPGGEAAAAGSWGTLVERHPRDSVAAPGSVTDFADAIEDVAGRAHERAERLRELDPVSQEVLVDIAEGLEKQSWRVRSQGGGPPARRTANRALTESSTPARSMAQTGGPRTMATRSSETLERRPGLSGGPRETLRHDDAPAKERPSWQPRRPKPILYANDSRETDEAKALLERYGIDFEVQETRDAHVSLRWNHSIYTDIFGIADFIMFAGRLLPEVRKGARGDQAVPGTMVPLRSR